jgi:hypothetical protein
MKNYCKKCDKIRDLGLEIDFYLSDWVGEKVCIKCGYFLVERKKGNEKITTI